MILLYLVNLIQEVPLIQKKFQAKGGSLPFFFFSINSFQTSHCSGIKTWNAVTENIWSLHSALLDWENFFPVSILSGVNWKPLFACKLVRCLVLHLQSEIYNFTEHIANIHRSKVSGKKNKTKNLTVLIQKITLSTGKSMHSWKLKKTVF